MRPFNRAPLRRAGFLLCLVLALSASRAQARMSSSNYLIKVDNFTSVGSSSTISGGSYLLTAGTMGQVGYTAMSGGAYTMKGGMLYSQTLATSNIDYAYAYPNPFKYALGHRSVKFTNLTTTATIHIYTISGELVKTIEKNTTVDTVGWDVNNEAGMRLASGLYIYVIESGSMRKTGKLIIIW